MFAGFELLPWNFGFVMDPLLWFLRVTGEIAVVTVCLGDGSEWLRLSHTLGVGLVGEQCGGEKNCSV